MSALLLSLAKENPWPALALASLNLAVALSLMGVGLVLGVTVSLVVWIHALLDGDLAPIARRAGRSAQ